MAKKKQSLIIVESPSKAKKIATYVDKDTIVLPSVGHIRDLPEFQLGVDVQKGFAPQYIIPKDKEKVVSDLRRAAAKCGTVYLASDPDREGESIAWHLYEVLKDVPGEHTFCRVRYNEVTKSAVLDALAHPTEIDRNLVDAQQARRVEDRLSGFKISKLISRSIRGARSAGRVQSVALRMIVDREHAVRDFRPTAYWLLGAALCRDKIEFEARLASVDGKVPKFTAYGKEISGVADEAVANAWLRDLEGRSVRVTAVERKPVTRRPPPPFITSTLQQAASTALHFSPDQTMRVAQALYEEGHITYMRTDGYTISNTIRGAVEAEIAKRYGRDCVPATPNFFGNKVKNAQEAHEPIRPTDVSKDVIPGLDAQQDALYRLIWQRFVASQMAAARFDRMTVTFVPTEPPPTAHAYRFTASAQKLVFKGYMSVWTAGEEIEEGDVRRLPELAEGDIVECRRWLCEGKETQPPPRFNEASLVKALEENGIGRPSTYASIIRTLLTRKYVTSNRNRVLTPTATGEEATRFLMEQMPEFIDIEFTAKMEDALDDVAAGKQDWVDKVSRFYDRLTQWLAADTARVKPILDQLGRVKTWNEPTRTKTGKISWDDRAFVDEMRGTLDRGEAVTKTQLATLTRLAVQYRGQLPDLAPVIPDLPPEVDPAEVEALFAAADARGENLNGWETRFLGSLRTQYARKRSLSDKQMTILRRIADPTSANDGERPDNAAQAQAMLDAFAAVTEWAEPKTRGKRTYDDREFVESLRGSLAERRYLTEKQYAALQKLAYAYREKLPGYATLAETCDIRPPAPRKRAAAGTRKTKKTAPKA